MPTIQEEKKQLFGLATNFSDFVKKHGWVSRYDIESDALSITTPRLSEDARIKYFDDEVAFYITNNNKIEGVFVEYFKTNFLKHHRKSKKIEKVLNELERKHKKDEDLVKIDISEVKEIATDLQEAIKTSLLSRLDLSPS